MSLPLESEQSSFLPGTNQPRPPPQWIVGPEVQDVNRDWHTYDPSRSTHYVFRKAELQAIANFSCLIRDRAVNNEARVPERYATVCRLYNFFAPCEYQLETMPPFWNPDDYELLINLVKGHSNRRYFSEMKLRAEFARNGITPYHSFNRRRYAGPGSSTNVENPGPVITAMPPIPLISEAPVPSAPSAHQSVQSSTTRNAD